MTCQELRRYFEDPSFLDDESCVGADHLAVCPACASFVETRRELRAGLRAIRESTPQCPGTLDGTVLAHYRRQVANGLLSVNSNSRRLGLAWVAWNAAAALLLVVALFFVGGRRKDTAVARPQSPMHQPFTPRSVIPIKTESVAHLAKPKPLNSARHGRHSPTFGEAGKGWASFRSLMYCDELSCGGAMQLIRVQLPSPGAALTPLSAAARGPVLADVLVGPDGVARGIRVVQ
jgi:hypothetical protein